MLGRSAGRGVGARAPLRRGARSGRGAVVQAVGRDYRKERYVSDEELQRMDDTYIPARKLKDDVIDRIDTVGPRMRELRDMEGQVRKEQFGPPAKLARPRWGLIRRITVGEFVRGCHIGDIKDVNMWADKPKEWYLPYRDTWPGYRALCTHKDGSQSWCQVSQTHPWWDIEKHVTDSAITSPALVSYTVMPSRKDLTEDDLVLVAIGGTAFVLASVVLGVLRKSVVPMDQFQAMEFGQSKANSRMEGKTGVGFDDVAGLDSAIDELKELVAFLKDPTRFNTVGARPPKGLLLEGPPGVGKTLIAKAVAGEAGVPFYTMSGSEFVEMIVGVGAARVRDLFKRARANAPCLIFVDEIDALGLKRQANRAKGMEEREQTLNQLLTEMDGFSPDTGIVFMGATNRADLLDPALLRPGRFDRKITVKHPNKAAREEILKIHLRSIKHSKDLDYQQIAKDTPGFSGADIMGLVKEATLLMVARKGSEITKADIDKAYDRVTMGNVRKSITKGHYMRRRLAVYELGHAVVAHVLRQRSGIIEEVDRITMLARGRHLTYTHFLRAEEETFTYATKQRLLERMMVLLGGYCAEQVFLGGASSRGQADIHRATSVAYRLLTVYALDEGYLPGYVIDEMSNSELNDQYGKSTSKTTALEESTIEANEYNVKVPGSGMRRDAEERALDLLVQAADDAMGILRDNKAGMDAAVDAILEADELTGKELARLLDTAPKAEQPRLPSAPPEAAAPVAA